MLYKTFYDEVINSEEKYTNKGNNYILKLSDNDLLNYRDQLFDSDDIELDRSYNDVLDRVFHSQDGAREFNLVFSGKVMNSSSNVMKQWLLKAVSTTGNLTSKLLINTKLTQIKHIVDNFFTVATSNGSESIRCCLKYSLVINADRSLENVFIYPEWYDPTCSLCCQGSPAPYKIFSVLSTLPDTVPNPLAKGITNVLKEIGFTALEMNEIFNAIEAVSELGKFTVDGNKKCLEFIGVSHFKTAAKKLQVKEQELHDFLIQEYTWKDSKKKLNTPVNINRDIRSFIFKLYGHVIGIIFEKFNSQLDNFREYWKINVYHSMTMPNFNDRQMYSYSDFLQYSQCSQFHASVTTILTNNVTIFATTTRNIAFNNEHSPDLITSISSLINQCKGEKNCFEFLKKSEKNFVAKIRFTKDPILSAQIFIAEFQIYVKFDWNSFLDNSVMYEEKRMSSFLKVSSSSIFRKYKIITSIPVNPVAEKIFKDLTLTVPMAINTYIIHIMVDDTFQAAPTYQLSKQITDCRLEYLSIEELSSVSISFGSFVSEYRILILKHDDTSTEFSKAAKHAINLLKLDKAWCSPYYLHLQTRHVNKLEMLKVNFTKSVITVQCLFRVFMSKVKLRNLKISAQTYKEMYGRAVHILQEFTDNFLTVYSKLSEADLEKADLRVVEKLLPSSNDIEEWKVEPFQWLTMLLMSGSNIVGKKSFTNSTCCVYYSKEDSFESSNSFDITTICGIELPSFIMKVEIGTSGDVTVELKSSKAMHVWNINSEISKEIHGSLSMSTGMLYPDKQYTLVSMDYIMKKIAYSVIRRVPYSFKRVTQESSFAIIIKNHPLNQKSISKAPVWLYFQNHFPICNLSSPNIFYKVENQIKKIDNNECNKYVKGPSTRPKVDWLTEDVYLQLLLISMESELRETGVDETDNKDTDILSEPRPSMMSDVDKHWSKINYKLRKYMFKNFNH